VTGYTGSTNFPTAAGAFQTSLAGYYNAFVTELNPSGSALVYSTYLGGSGVYPGYGDTGSGIAVDSAGNAYVTGYTYSSNFPTTGGAFQTSLAGYYNAFVAKFALAPATLAPRLDQLQRGGHPDAQPPEEFHLAQQWVDGAEHFRCHVQQFGL
jgi:hypothetical protein